MVVGLLPPVPCRGMGTRTHTRTRTVRLVGRRTHTDYAGPYCVAHLPAAPNRGSGTSTTHTTAEVHHRTGMVFGDTLRHRLSEILELRAAWFYRVCRVHRVRASRQDLQQRPDRNADPSQSLVSILTKPSQKSCLIDAMCPKHLARTPQLWSGRSYKKIPRV